LAPKSEIENLTLPALLQDLIRQVRNDQRKPAKKHVRLIKKTACEILRRGGFSKKVSSDLSKMLIEQEQ